MRTPTCPAGPARKRSQSHGPATMDTLVPSANSAMMAAPSAALALMAATKMA